MPISSTSSSLRAAASLALARAEWVASFTAAGSFCERGVSVKKLVDPDGQGESRTIESVIFKAIRRAGCLVDGAIVFIRRSPSASSASTSSLQSLAIQQLGPTHFAGDDLVALRDGRDISRAAPCISPSCDPAAGENAPTRIRPRRDRARARNRT